MASGSCVADAGRGGDRVQTPRLARRVSPAGSPVRTVSRRAENWMAVAGPAIPLALLAGAYALKRGWIFFAWCSLAPLAGTAGWLGVRIAGF